MDARLQILFDSEKMCREKLSKEYLAWRIEDAFENSSIRYWYRVNNSKYFKNMVRCRCDRFDKYVDIASISIWEYRFKERIENVKEEMKNIIYNESEILNKDVKDIGEEQFDDIKTYSDLDAVLEKDIGLDAPFDNGIEWIDIREMAKEID